MDTLYIKVRLNEKEKDVLRHLPKDTAAIVEKLILNNRELQKLNESVKNLKSKVTILNDSLEYERSKNKGDGLICDRCRTINPDKVNISLMDYNHSLLCDKCLEETNEGVKND